MNRYTILLLSLLLWGAFATIKTVASSSTTSSSHDTSAKLRTRSTSSNAITTVAGYKVNWGGSEMDGIIATGKKLSSPQGIAFDKEGNFYIATSDDNKIYKVTESSGIITTVAGTGDGSYGGDGGQATSAMLNGPKGVTPDTTGDIYIADTLNHRVRKITMSTGLITTVAGDGKQYDTKDNIAATSTSLNSPTDVAVDPYGNMFIADTDNGRIRKVTASTGIITTIAGSGNPYDAFEDRSAVATKYYLQEPTGVTLDTAGNVYIAGGLFDPCILKVTVSTGNISVVAGTGPYLTGTVGYNGDDILATAANLYYPTKVVFDASGNMYISDSGNHRIRKVTKSTGMITTVAGTGAVASIGFSSNGEFGLATAASIYTPSGIAVDTAGNLYFADANYNVVRKVTYTGATPL